MKNISNAVQLDLFDNGVDKLSLNSVRNREQIIRYYAENEGAIFYVSTSGGVDSAALAITVRKLVDPSKIVYIHATLGEYEYDVIDYIKQSIDSELVVVKNKLRSLIDSVLLKGKWFSSAARYCTSEFKTNPIYSYIRSDMTERQQRGENVRVAFNCTGILASESRMRAKKNPLFLNKNLTTKTRKVYDWLPVFTLSKEQVWDTIKNAGQRPHEAYGEKMGEGVDRLSCRICCMASVDTMRKGALSSPDVYHTYIAVERVTGHTLFFKTKQRTENITRFDLLTQKEIVIEKIVHKTHIKIPLHEKLGLPYDELAVQKKMVELSKRREELLKIKAENDQAKQDARNDKTKKSSKSLRDEFTGTFGF